MRDSSYVHNIFPLSTPYFTVLSNGSGLNTTPNLTPWYAGLGADQDQGIVFIEHFNPNNGFVVKNGYNVPAVVLVPMPYIYRLQASSGVMIIAGPLTGAYTVPTPADNQNIFAFKNGIPQATVPATIPVSTSDMWAIVITNDKVAGSSAAYSATLAASPLTGTHGTTVVTFTLTETNKPSGATGSYVWNFGDGSQAVTTTTPTTTYTYPAAGTYTAHVTPTINGVTEAQVTAAAPAVIS
jgi:hypothetical protein